MAKMRLGVLFGGRSGEHEVSIRSARSVIREINADKYEVFPIAITKSGQWWSGSAALSCLERGDLDSLDHVTILPEPGETRIYKRNQGKALEILTEVDVVFPVLHGSYGEDGTLQGLLELAEIPYVGAGVLASSVGMDKALFKDVMRAWGIPVLDFVLLTDKEISQDMEAALDKAEQLGKYPYFAKPVNMGSSVGVSKCSGRSDLIEGIMDAVRYDRRVLIEKGLDAREIEVSVLGNEEPEASIAGEIVPGDVFYSYRAKYIDDTSELIIPAPIEESLSDEIRYLAVESFRAIDGAGMARVDFLLDRKTNTPYLNELNTLPGFTSISMYPKLWEASGLPYPKLLDRLIELALERHTQKAALIRTYEVGQ
ncbi:MAG: D-alanine--D-alanine ligase [Anaerolineales bacterium]|nr:D-alanine--D-alanine ligase [Anaerolineales bacterium]